MMMPPPEVIGAVVIGAIAKFLNVEQVNLRDRQIMDLTSSGLRQSVKESMG